MFKNLFNAKKINSFLICKGHFDNLIKENNFTSINHSIVVFKIFKQ